MYIKHFQENPLQMRIPSWWSLTGHGLHEWASYGLQTQWVWAKDSVSKFPLGHRLSECPMDHILHGCLIDHILSEFPFGPHTQWVSFGPLTQWVSVLWRSSITVSFCWADTENLRDQATTRSANQLASSCFSCEWQMFSRSFTESKGLGKGTCNKKKTRTCSYCV